VVNGGVDVDRISVLKIDKDCHVERSLETEYVEQAIGMLSKHHVKVQWIKTTRTRYGSHYYIHIKPSVDANTANRLQYLLGDDTKRVSLNQARINSGLQEWNLLFEPVGRQLRTLYFVQTTKFTGSP
jgi:hypothetical protein